MSAWRRGPGPGQRLERRDWHDLEIARERQPLDRRDADADAGERSRARRRRRADRVARARRPTRPARARCRRGRRSPCVRAASPGRSQTIVPSRTIAMLPCAGRRIEGQDYHGKANWLNVILGATARPHELRPMSSPVSSEPAGATPAMRQYFEAKRQYRDAIVFFRMGDFYEMFYEDALTAARALELTLTSRSKDSSGGAIPMCGVPYHAADAYIARLVKKGFRVAICEQIEDPKKAKGLVRREVVRVVSPGTLTDAGYLEAREPAFLMAIAPDRRRGPAYGVALLDLSTGEFTTAEYAGAGRRAGTRRRAGDPAAARDPRPRRLRRSRGARCGAAAGRPSDHRPMTGRSRSSRRARTLLDQLQTQKPRRVRPRGAHAGDPRRGRPRSVPEGHAEGRSRARARRSRSEPAPTACRSIRRRFAISRC